MACPLGHGGVHYWLCSIGVPAGETDVVFDEQA
jgi:hypothetical protein